MNGNDNGDDNGDENGIIAVPRTLTPTVPIVIPRAYVDSAIQVAKEELRLEWVANIDRQALERAIDLANSVQRASHRRFNFLLVCIVLIDLMLAFAGSILIETRVRIDTLERRGE